MDILAARKKAAEQASARNKPEPEVAAPAAQPRQEQEAPPAPAESLPGGIVEPPAAESLTNAAETAPDTTVTIPDASDGAPEATRQREIEMLSFRLSGEEYAVMVADVREVLKIPELTRVPNAPEYIQGVTSLRGTMLPVIDLCTRLGLKPAERNEKARIIVISTDDEDVGLIVDRVNGVIRALPEAIKPAPEHVEQGADFLRGIVRQGDKLHIVLDLHKAAVM
jgi:purine-binding chemotaxis protein CheW